MQTERESSRDVGSQPRNPHSSHNFPLISISQFPSKPYNGSADMSVQYPHYSAPSGSMYSGPAVMFHAHNMPANYTQRPPHLMTMGVHPMIMPTHPPTFHGTHGSTTQNTFSANYSRPPGSLMMHSQPHPSGYIPVMALHPGFQHPGSSLHTSHVHYGQVPHSRLPDASPLSSFSASHKISGEESGMIHGPPPPVGDHSTNVKNFVALPHVSVPQHHEIPCHPNEHTSGPVMHSICAPRPINMPPQMIIPPHMSVNQNILGNVPHIVSNDQENSSRRSMERKILKRAANRRSAQLSRQRKKAQFDDLHREHQALKRQEEILDVVPDPVIAFNVTEGKIWFASRSAASQFGLEVTELLSMSFFNLMTADCSNRLRTLVSKALSDQPSSDSMLLGERMTVRFRKGGKGSNIATLLGELSGRLNRQDSKVNCVCSVRLLSLMFDDHGEAQKLAAVAAAAAATDYNGDQSTSDMDPDGGSQHCNGEESASIGSSSGSASGACCNISPMHQDLAMKNMTLLNQPNNHATSRHTPVDHYSDSIGQESSGIEGDDEKLNATELSSNDGSIAFKNSPQHFCEIDIAHSENISGKGHCSVMAEKDPSSYLSVDRIIDKNYIFSHKVPNFNNSICRNWEEQINNANDLSLNRNFEKSCSTLTVSLCSTQDQKKSGSNLRKEQFHRTPTKGNLNVKKTQDAGSDESTSKRQCVITNEKRVNRTDE